MEIKIDNIPINIRMVALSLHSAGYEAYFVGGAVRDLLMGRTPHDWDIATNANPEQIISLFPHTFYENDYGTVGVVLDESLGLNSHNIVEVTPFRGEGVYTDGRHPDQVTWVKDIKDDLLRRDFTCNAIALDIKDMSFIDPYSGLKDIESRTLRAVRDPDMRFGEDALRLMRLIRFSCQLDFQIDPVTHESAKRNAYKLKNIPIERVTDEFKKLLMTNNPMSGLIVAHETGLLRYFLPELENGIGIEQNQAHSFDVWEHNLRTLQHAADKGWDINLRLSALFHDISKPETRKYSAEKKDYTFYGHDVVGGRVTRVIMERMKFPKEQTEKVALMVRWHMFFSDTEQISLAAVRRLITNVGKDNIWDLMNLRICDRVGTGRPKEEPYRFRKYQSMIEQALIDPISLKQLKIDGQRIMSVTHEKPGPIIGLILNALFEEVLDDPSLNTVEYLEQRALHMKSLPLDELRALAEKGRDLIEEKNQAQVASIRKSFHVK